MAQLTNKVALVTGGGSGIGRAVAEQLLQAGARVAIAGRNQAKLDEVARAVHAGDRLVTHAVDVADAAAVSAMVAAVSKKLGPIDILVNNAGTNIKERTFRELTVEAWDRLIRTNLDGAFYCIHAVLPAMLQRRDGVIVNIVSVAGKRANPLGIGLAAEEKDSGIRVCNVYPGEVDTPILEARPQPLSAEHRQRILRPDDVASAVLFVAGLPAHVSVPELVIKPTWQVYV